MNNNHLHALWAQQGVLQQDLSNLVPAPNDTMRDILLQHIAAMNRQLYTAEAQRIRERQIQLGRLRDLYSRPNRLVDYLTAYRP